MAEQLAPATLNWLWAAACVAGLAGIGLWLRRERSLAVQRRTLRALYGLSEELLAVAGAAEVIRRLRTSLPRIAGARAVRFYLYNHSLATLDPVSEGAHPRARPVNGNTPAGQPGAAIASCFRNRTLLTNSVARGSPLFSAPLYSELEARTDDDLLLVPMLARGDALGVMVMEYPAGGNPSATDQQAALQHLANQAATAMKLFEQQATREQLMRSEKLAATGQLISGVAGELRVPLAAIASRVKQLVPLVPQGPVGIELDAIAEEASEASGLVERLVAMADPGAREAARIDLNQLLRRLLDFRQQEWRVRGIQFKISLAADPILVAGAAGQLEKAFLNLLVHAEQCLEGETRAAEIATSVLGKRALCQIRYASGFTVAHGTDSLQVVQGILRGHGGDLRPLGEADHNGLEIFLPLAEPEPQPETAGASSEVLRRLTTLVVEPDLGAQRDLVRLLGDRRHRSVPVSNAEEALHLLERMRFDVVFCSVRLPGANWMEFHERSHKRAGVFVLLSEGFDQDLETSLRNHDSWLLRKPATGGDLDLVLHRIAGRVGT